MDLSSPTHLSDNELLAETARVVRRERRTTAELLALLAELDVRKLYLGAGCSSLFTYCTQILLLSEPAAYSRITAARTARRFPMILDRLVDGAITLTTVALLAAHLTDENHEALLEAACHKSKREVECLIAALDPQPDFASSVRKLPAAAWAGTHDVGQSSFLSRAESSGSSMVATPVGGSLLRTPVNRPVVAPIASERYLVKITIGRETHAKLERARDWLRHTIPTGDTAAIVDRALTVLLQQLEKTKRASRARPRSRSIKTSTSRHVPAGVKRAVWARDQGRCAFMGSEGRCKETGFLEFHHVLPFAVGGATITENLQLRCRAHNGYEAECYFGKSYRAGQSSDRGG